MMKLSFNDWVMLYPHQVFLQITPSDRDRAWQQTQHVAYSYAAARWRAYRNCLCVHLVREYFAGDETAEKPQLACSLEEYLRLWELIDGFTVVLEKTRLTIVPEEGDYVCQLRVQREWVDIAGWRSDYYLGVQANLTDNWIRIWGYTTYQHLRQAGTYHPTDESYSLEASDLVEDLTALWLSREIVPQGQLTNKVVPLISPAKAQELLQVLGKPSWYSPRLDLPFREWAALLANPHWRRELCDRRCQEKTKTVSDTINLLDWFGQQFQAGWQSLDRFLDRQPRQLAFRKRQIPTSDTRQIAVEGIKAIDLGMQLGHQSVALLLGVVQSQGDRRVSVRVQLHPANGDKWLPSNIRLALLSESGNVLQELTSRGYDNFMQLKRFTCPYGKSFKIEVSLKDFRIAEEFAIAPRQ
ncbi:DUF1822 family protein [Geitlerinema sp. PCC 9228]|uniref:DUF1822 family protein n=1 Tax=Geitlerinema sp. PCC 9228 TaxID=111611 RepID=UPI000A053283|nr:DUF1822 family protein [Geitlerinema sp. PCC 9228]